jgi:hypothetical protein
MFNVVFERRQQLLSSLAVAGEHVRVEIAYRGGGGSTIVMSPADSSR